MLDSIKESSNILIVLPKGKDDLFKAQIETILVQWLNQKKVSVTHRACIVRDVDLLAICEAEEDLSNHVVVQIGEEPIMSIVMNGLLVQD